MAHRINQWPIGSIEIDIHADTDLVFDELEKLRQEIRDEAPIADLFHRIKMVEEELENITFDLT